MERETHTSTTTVVPGATATRRRRARRRPRRGAGGGLWTKRSKRVVPSCDRGPDGQAVADHPVGAPGVGGLRSQHLEADALHQPDGSLVPDVDPDSDLAGIDGEAGVLDREAQALAAIAAPLLGAEDHVLDHGVAME